MLFIRATLC